VVVLYDVKVPRRHRIRDRPKRKAWFQGVVTATALGPGPIHQSILTVDFAAATHFDKRFRAEAGVEVVDDPITVKIVRRRHRRRRHQPRPAGSGRQAAA
jgi:hypothetical protein